MACKICGRSPAAAVTLKSASSRIVWWVRSSIESELCGVCAEMAYIQQQSKTLKQGWWGPLSALATIWFGITNIFAIKNHREQVREVASESGAVTRPHFSIRNDNLTMLGLAVGVLAWTGVLIYVASMESTSVDVSKPDSYIGSCWAETSTDMMKRVDCSDQSATYQLYTIVSSSASCPDSYFELDGKYGCLRRYK